MSEVERLLTEYVALDEESATAPDPHRFLERASESDRTDLARRIDAHLTSRGRRPWDAAAFERDLHTSLMRGVDVSVRGVSGLWPAFLPRLRNQARLKRREVVERLSNELGVAGREEKVARYYHRMEQGLLDERGVSDIVLEKLGRILGASTESLRDAGRALGTGALPDESGSVPVFARTAAPDPAYGSAEPVAPAELGMEEWDEVDELFAGGRP